MKDFSTILEEQVRQDVRDILNRMIGMKNMQFIDGKWVITIDIAQAENDLVKLALEMY